MLIRRDAPIPSSEITDERLYLERREFLKAAGLAAIGLAASAGSLEALPQAGRPARLEGVTKGPFGTTEAQTPYDAVTTYNNFYEFGTDKSDPA
jgi:sulfoxide reductase catalytic subunit YedY